MLTGRASLRSAALSAAFAVMAMSASAEEVTIGVWAGGTGPNDNYRLDAIEMAADLLMKEAAIRGDDLTIVVEKRAFNNWDDFKQGVTLAAESGTAPNIVVTGHEDIAPWAQSGLITPIEDYIDLDAWPVNDIYENLIEIASFNGQVYGLPQDAESRPFFFWKPYLEAIGYSAADIEALPAKVQAGDYTLYDMLDDAQKAQDAGLVEPGYGFYPRVTNGPDYWQFYLSFGGEMQDPATGKLVFDKVAMTKTYQFFADAVAKGVTRKNHIGTPWDQWYNEVANGKAAFWHGGTWHYARYTTKEGQDDFFGNIQFTLIPAGDQDGTSNTLTHPLVYLLTMQESEDDMAIAAELVVIASEPRINALHAIKSAHLGISKQEANIDLYSSDRWAREATERLLPYASAMPNNADFGQYWNIMWKGLESVWTGQKTADEAIADAETELHSTLGDAVIIR